MKLRPRVLLRCSGVGCPGGRSGRRHAVTSEIIWVCPDSISGQSKRSLWHPFGRRSPSQVALLPKSFWHSRAGRIFIRPAHPASLATVSIWPKPSWPDQKKERKYNILLFSLFFHPASLVLGRYSPWLSWPDELAG